MSSSHSDQVKRAVTVLGLAVNEITIGLEQDNSADEQGYWKSKLHAMFLYKTLVGLHSIDASGELTSEQFSPDDVLDEECSNAAIKEATPDEKEYNIMSDASEPRNIADYCSLPCMCLSLYFELVKGCKWHAEFTQASLGWWTNSTCSSISRSPVT